MCLHNIRNKFETVRQQNSNSKAEMVSEARKASQGLYTTQLLKTRKLKIFIRKPKAPSEIPYNRIIRTVRSWMLSKIVL